MTSSNGAAVPLASAPNAIPQRQTSPGGETVHSLSVDAVQQWKNARTFEVTPVVRAGGALLAICAGLVNAVAIRQFATKVSHLTGTWTDVGMGLGVGGTDPVLPALLTVSFVGGSSLTGFLVAKDTPHFGMALYDMVLLLECALLVATTVFYEDTRVAVCLASAACGMQNGMCTQWGGAVVRTTHVTGLFTDVGLCIGRIVSKVVRKGRGLDLFDKAFLADDFSKLSVLLSIALSFALGAAIGTHMHHQLNELAFLVPAAIVGTVGIFCLLYRVFVEGRKLFSDDEQECIDIPAAMQGAVVAMQPDAQASFAKIGSFRRQTSNASVMTVSRAVAKELHNEMHKRAESRAGSKI